jgi:hypothetical protein
MSGDYMATTIKPVMYKTQETAGYLSHLADDIKNTVGNDSDLLLNHPALYIHVWRNKCDYLNGTWSIYVGETNDIIERTKQHWNEAKVPPSKRKTGNWQYHMIEDVDDKGKQVIPMVYFFGHKLFHKSLTLDIENKLIDFCLAMETAHTHNGRGNAQGYYSGDDNLDDIFSMIWRELRKDNPDIFLTEASIKKSAIYKASPNHQLTDDQKAAKQLIIDRTVDAILTGGRGQLVFVEGEAGTGKTVLASSAFYGIIENELLKRLDLSCYMLMNHEEQRNVYKNMARKLGYSDDIVQIPTTFLKQHSILDSVTNTYIPDLSNIVDLVFVDEAHLLWNQNNQDYNTKFKEPQLDEIMKRARVTVIMFDENQILHKGQISAMNYMVAKRNLAKSQGPNPAGGEDNYIQMVNQLRMNCSKETMDWIDDISKNLVVPDIRLDSKHKDSNGYEVCLFDTPTELHDAIKLKAAKDETQLSRVIATYDWKYINGKFAPATQKYWQVDINGWTLPWNEQLYHVDIKQTLNNRQKRRYDALDWAEKDYTINEAGSTFTIQGFDLAYSGVILGPSVRYDKATKRIWFDERLRAWDNMIGNRTLQDGTVVNVTNTISQHELRVLMTRGTRGLYIYACDDDLRDALKNAIKSKNCVN